MTKTSLAAALAGTCLAFAPLGAAMAQTGWVPGAEITGHAVQVNTNGVMSTVYFDPGGAARIVSQTGTEVPARWYVQNQNLCLETGAGVSECWPYTSAFRAGQPVTLTSNCQATSQFTALSTNQPPVQQRAGERG